MHRRGINVSKGIRDSGLIGSWSATALIDAPDIVQQVHEDYLSVGADIITTNSFWTNRPRLGLVNLSEKIKTMSDRVYRLPETYLEHSGMHHRV